MKRRNITIPFERITRRRENFGRRRKQKLPLYASSKKEMRNWLCMPYDIMILIFSKLDFVEILYCAQFVCLYWLQLSKDPQLFRSASFPNVYIYDKDENNKNIHDDSDEYGEYDNDGNVKVLKWCKKIIVSSRILKEVVDRSCGELMEISLKAGWCRDQLLHYVVDKSNSLKSLQLESCSKLTAKGLLEACRKLPLLEKLELNLAAMISKQVVQDIGRSCTHLKYFHLDYNRISFFTRYPPEKSLSKMHFEEMILAIVDSMPQLRGLRLSKYRLTNNGLQRILDGCIHLENLELRGCFATNPEKEFLKKCVARLRYLSFPCTEIPKLGGFSLDTWRGKMIRRLGPRQGPRRLCVLIKPCTFTAI